VVTDLVTGTGPSAAVGDNVVVHYVGVRSATGEEFDNSYDRGEPFEVSLGAGRVIQGWDQGMAGMRVGGKRILTIPSHLGYGSMGSYPSIPPNAGLVFEVELLQVQ
jgi:peptidylprolyl isomerase